MDLKDGSTICKKISVLDESAILERVVSDYSFALDTLVITITSG